MAEKFFQNHFQRFETKYIISKETLLDLLLEFEGYLVGMSELIRPLTISTTIRRLISSFVSLWKILTLMRKFACEPIKSIRPRIVKSFWKSRKRLRIW